MKKEILALSFVVVFLTAALTASAAAEVLEITPVEDFASSGEIGGPFTPSSKNYLLTNTGPNSLLWVLDKTVDWLDIDNDWGFLDPCESTIVTITVTSEANSLSEGEYTDTLTFIDITNDEQQTRGVTLSIIAPGVLGITPAEDFEPSGLPGGPFSPSSKDYQLANNGGISLNWQIDKTVNWLDVDPNNGALDPCELVMITVSLNIEANSLGDGIYSDTLTFTDTTNNEQQTRGVTLSVGSIWVSPGIFNINIVEGCTLTETLTIGNEGIEDLDFMIRTRQVGNSEELVSIDGMSTVAAGSVVSSIPKYHDFTVAGNTPYKPGELIVRFAAKANGQMHSSQEKNQILISLGGATIKHDFNIVPGLSVVELPAGMTVEEALQTFNGADGILYAEPDYEVQICSTFPDDTRFDDLWGMHNTGQTGGTVDADIDAPEAWDIGTGSSEIIVAVIDTGVDYTHPDLAANMWVNEAEYNGIPGIDDDGNGYVDDIYGYDFVNNDGDPMDDSGWVYHGTHCSGTIGGIGNNGEGVAGVNWNVTLMAVKCFDSGGSGWYSDCILAVQYATLMGANVTSNSWGGSGYSQGLKDAFDAAGAAGMLSAAAAGNRNQNTDSSPHYPSSFDSESIISVMATDHSDNKASFSSYGPISVDLGAPGVDILSCKGGGGYQYLDGTSMATPHVAGACALLWSMNPVMSNDEVKDILLRTVDEISALAGKCVSEGRLNLYQAILETNAPWIAVEPETGTIGPAESNDISVTFDAMELTPGTYEAEIVIISSAASEPFIVPVTMTVTADDLQVIPADGFESSGTEGGPFEPNRMVYTLTNNNGAESVNWMVWETEDWLDVEPNQGVLDPCEAVDINVCISPDANLLDPNIYTDVLTFQNTDSNSIKPRLITLTVNPPDCFTELFDSGRCDIESYSLTLSPDGSIAYYEACRDKITDFPTDPNSGTYVALGDDDFVEVPLANDVNVLFYGQWYDRFYIGSNGYITFGSGDTEYEAILENHFDIPRISAVFADLTPTDIQSISYKQLDDRIVVTFRDVPIFGDKNAKNSFQVEMFFVDGTICISWLDLNTTSSIVGISKGVGVPPVLFTASDLSTYPPCWPLCDFDRNYFINSIDFSVLAKHWMNTNCGIPYWCEKSDVDFSGTIDSNDLGILAGDWLLESDYWWLQPLSHWRFDEGSGTTAYDSIGNYDGTLVGDPCWVTGNIGDYALSFDGNGDYVDCGDIDELDGATSFTIGAWINTNTISTDKLIARKGEDYPPLLLWVNADYTIHFGFYYAPGGFYTATTTATISPNQWFFVAGTYDGDAVRTYINGVEKAANTDASGPTNSKSDSLRIGSGYPDYPTAWFDGKIDDVRIYERALSTEEIQQLYQEGAGGKAYNPNPSDQTAGIDPNTLLTWTPGKDALSHDVYFGTGFDDVNDANEFSDEYKGNQDVNNWDPCGLELETLYFWRIDEVGGPNTVKGQIWSFTTLAVPISHWEFDEGSGTDANDSAGNNHGTLVGVPNWVTGKIGSHALEFDGSGDYVEMSDSDSLSITGDLSICLWFYPTDEDTKSQDVLWKGRTDGQRSYAIPITNAGRFMFYLTPDGTQANRVYRITGTNAYSYNDWNHAAVTYDADAATKMRIYIDGVEKSTTLIGGTEPSSIHNSSESLTISKGFNNYFEGTIDDVRIYDKTLSADEIQSIYQEGL